MSNPKIKVKIEAATDGVEEALGRTKDQIDKARQAAEGAADILGIKIPSAVEELLAKSELVGPAFEAAFEPLAVIGAIQTILDIKDKLKELMDEHDKLTAAIYGSGGAWKAVESTASTFSANTQIKLLEIQQRVDELNKNQSAALKDKLQIISLQNFDKLKEELSFLGDAGKKAFQSMEEGSTKAFLFGDGAAQKNIKRIADDYELLVEQIEGAAKAKNLKGIGSLLDEQITKTEKAIATDKKFAETTTQKQILQAYKRRLDLLKDLKQAYSEVNQEGEAEANLANLEEQKKKDQERTEAANKLSQTHAASAKQWQDVLAHAGAAIRQIADETERHQEQAAVRFDQYNLRAIENENKATIKANTEKLESVDAYYQNQEIAAQGAEKVQEAGIQQQLLKHQINQQQEIQAVAKAKQDELAIEIGYLRKREELWTGDAKKVEAIEKQIVKAQQQSALIGTKAVTDSLKSQQQDYQKLFSGISSGFTGAMTGLLQGNETIAQSFQKMYQNILQSIVGFYEAKLEKEAESFLESLFMQKAQATSMIGTQAAVGGAAAYADSALTGPEGLLAAPAAAALAEANITTFVSEADSSAGGQWRVPRTQFQIVHENETILPSNIAGRLRTMVEGGGLAAGVAGRAANLHVHFNMSAVDGESAAKFIKGQSRNIASVVYKELKKKGMSG
jgi:hypothetical protein